MNSCAACPTHHAGTPTPPEPAPPRSSRLRRILAFVLLFVLVRATIIDWNRVPSGSMMPTILPGDMILVSNLSYHFRIPFTNYLLATWSGPEAGDIIVFHAPRTGTRCVKRVVGVPGDDLQVRAGGIYRNGQYAGEAQGEPLTLVVPEGHYFVMGDNRAESLDSRCFGCVARDHIVGRASAVLLSMDRDGWYVPRWERFCVLLANGERKHPE